MDLEKYLESRILKLTGKLLQLLIRRGLRELTPQTSWPNLLNVRRDRIVELQKMGADEEDIEEAKQSYVNEFVIRYPTIFRVKYMNSRTKFYNYEYFVNEQGLYDRIDELEGENRVEYMIKEELQTRLISPKCILNLVL